MALRTAHGRAATHGAPGPRVEVLPPDELPAPLPGRAPPSQPSPPRASKGRFTKDSAAIIGAAGGRASKGRPSLVSSLGISGDVPMSMQAFDSYRRKAASFRRAHTAELSALAGGACGTGPSSMVASAALQLAASRYLYDLATKGEEGPDLKMLHEARMQADSSRQNLLAAYELAIREGKARALTQPGMPDLDEVTRRAEQEADARRVARRQRLPPTTIEASGGPTS